MKRIKYLFIALAFVPLFLPLNSSAETRNFITSRSINRIITTKKNTPSNTYETLTFNSQTLGQFPEQEVPIKANNRAYLVFNPNFYLNQSIDVTNDTHFTFDFTVSLRTPAYTYPFSDFNLLPNCPTSTSMIYIDSCTITVAKDSSSISTLSPSTSYSQLPGYGWDSATSNSLAFNYQISGHYAWSSGTLERLVLNGNFYSADSVASTSISTPLDFPVYVSIIASDIDFYTVVDSGTDRVVDELDEQNQKDDQDRSDIQQQQSDSQDGSDEAAEAITSASDSLLAVIGNFVNIVIHPPQRDCTIDGDMGHMDLGTIDLCQLSPPPAISTVATLLIIGFVIPFAYGIIATILNLLKGATQ